ncbi:hypothetical protein QTP88_020319 [Uroleucon formosanum]
MSNDSLHSLPWFSAESYNRVLGATPPEDSPPDFFYVPGRTFVLVNRPLPPRPITPRPITPRPVAPAFDFSQDAQQFTQTSSSPHSPDMFPPTTLQQSTPTTLRQSQIEEWLRSSSMSTIVPAENDSLIFGRILSTSQPSQNETGWADDGYENIMVMHMSAHEGQWHKDGADEDLNLIMDVYEACKEITEAFSQCRNIKLPSDVKEIAELNFGILFSLELPNKLTKEEFTQKSLEEKIELLSVPKSLYLYYFLSKDDLIQILRFFNKEFSKNSETIELRFLVRSILNRNQSEDDNDSDPDFIPKPFNIEQRSPVITRSKKRDTELVDPNNINNRLETFNMSKPIFFKPKFYSGEPDECVNDFIENYNLISAANEWSDDKKIMYAPIYLKKSAKAFYQNYIISNPTPSWSHFELALKEYFMSPGRARMLKAKLTNRKLKLNETVSQFLADFQLLAHKVNPNMAESEKIDLILEALPPDFYNPVALMNNNTLSDLQNNLRKVESAKATVNERNNIHNFDALKAEIEVLNKKLVE